MTFAVDCHLKVLCVRLGSEMKYCADWVGCVVEREGDGGDGDCDYVYEFEGARMNLCHRLKLL